MNTNLYYRKVLTNYFHRYEPYAKKYFQEALKQFLEWCFNDGFGNEREQSNHQRLEAMLDGYKERELFEKLHLHKQDGDPYLTAQQMKSN